MPAFPFSTSVFPILSKVDAAFVALLQSPSRMTTSDVEHGSSTTDKVRIKSMITETRTTVVNWAYAAGYTASIQDLSSDDDTESENGEGILDEENTHHDASVNMALSKIYKGTLEILGDSLT